MPALDFLETVILDAGEIALRHYCGEPNSWQKSDGQGCVSEADLEIDAFLCDKISQAFPEDSILSEERADHADRLEADRVWIIDPIDGTSAFLDKQDYFSISIALWEKGDLKSAAIYAPVLKDLYIAEHTQGAWRNQVPLKVSKKGRISEARILASRATYNRKMVSGEPELNLEFCSSIALRLALVAEGKLDASFAMRPSWEWDLAAGALLVQEAGGIIVDQNGKYANFNKYPPQWDGMIAGNQNIVQKLIKRLD